MTFTNVPDSLNGIVITIKDISFCINNFRKSTAGLVIAIIAGYTAINLNEANSHIISPMHKKVSAVISDKLRDIKIQKLTNSMEEHKATIHNITSMILPDAESNEGYVGQIQQSVNTLKRLSQLLGEENFTHSSFTQMQKLFLEASISQTEIDESFQRLTLRDISFLTNTEMLPPLLCTEVSEKSNTPNVSIGDIKFNIHYPLCEQKNHNN